jgi:hypothetical protein
VEANREGAASAWDELEQSVVIHIADEVKVSIRGREVTMTIYKKMGKKRVRRQPSRDAV